MLFCFGMVLEISAQISSHLWSIGFQHTVYVDFRKHHNIWTKPNTLYLASTRHPWKQSACSFSQLALSVCCVWLQHQKGWSLFVYEINRIRQELRNSECIFLLLFFFFLTLRASAAGALSTGMNLFNLRSCVHHFHSTIWTDFYCFA